MSLLSHTRLNKRVDPLSRRTPGSSLLAGMVSPPDSGPPMAASPMLPARRVSGGEPSDSSSSESESAATALPARPTPH